MKDSKEITSTQQFESDSGFYVGAYGGAQFASSYINRHQEVSGGGLGYVGDASPTKDSWGGAAGIKAGYNFESFRLCDTMSLRWQPAIEAEALYIGGRGDDSFGGGGLGTARSNYNSAAFFVNGILRIKNSSCITPYFGVGIGGEYMTSSVDVTTNYAGHGHITGINSDDLAFAAQGLGGIDVKLSKHISLFGEYKFIDAINPNLSGAGGGGTYYHYNPGQIQQQVVVAGVKYNF